MPAGWAMLRAGAEPAAEPNRQRAAGVSEAVVAEGSINDPFAGTPAATYPKGEAGIDLPAAKAVTGFSAAQVDAALAPGQWEGDIRVDRP